MPPPSTSSRASGLTAEFGDKAYSETVPAGQVMSTDPSAGEHVLDGGSVVVVLSLGKERYDVPKLRGLTEDRAQDELLDTSLAFGESIGRFSETVPKGTVLRSDPPVGTTLRPDAVVDLVVSKGPRPIHDPGLHRRGRRPRHGLVREAGPRGRHLLRALRHGGRGRRDLPVARRRHRLRR